MQSDRILTVDVELSGQRVRAYAFTYQASASTERSLLASVTVYGKDAVLDGNGAVVSGTSLPETSYSYRDDAQYSQFDWDGVLWNQDFIELELAVQDGAVSPGRAAALLGEAIAALAKAHRIGLVHRDLKPAYLSWETSRRQARRLRAREADRERQDLSALRTSWLSSSSTGRMRERRATSPRARDDPERRPRRRGPLPPDGRRQLRGRRGTRSPPPPAGHPVERVESPFSEGPLVRVSSPCAPARESYMKRALELNADIPHGAISIDATAGAPLFVLTDHYPYATCDPEAVRAGVLTIARSADEIENALTGEDVH